MNLHRDQRAFTIIELMIATVVFSVILLMATYGLLQVGRMFYKGVTISRTQEAARTLMEEITQSIQFSGEQIVEPQNTGSLTLDRFCIGSRRYSFMRGRQITSAINSARAIVVDEGLSSCGAAQDISNLTSLTPTSRELLQPGMRLSELTITPLNNGLYEVYVRVVNGDDDLLNNPALADANCLNIRQGSQFCAVSEFRTTVLKRINVE